ncbi:MAG: (2Fe-2S)-binding protein [Eubacteriales bacterium]
MVENKTICHCMNVSFADVDKALHECKTFGEVEETFSAVQSITHCSTGCGGCHDDIMAAISQLMNG